jgi:chromosome segregation ATPase
LRKLMLLGLILVMPGPLPALAQSVPPSAPAAANADPNSEFNKTQAFIAKTQSKIDRVRGESEARAREIEALATRVSDIISAMSSQGEDNTNLISEISVLNELLTIERQTTTSLRSDIESLNGSRITRDAEHKAAEAALKKQHREDVDAGAEREAALSKDIVRAQDITAAAQKNLTAAEKKLSSALGSIAGQAQTSRVLASDVNTLRKQVRRLKSEIKLVKRRRASTLPRRPTPNIPRPASPRTGAQ